MVSYGLAYGMESYGLGQRLNIPTEEAQVILWPPEGAYTTLVKSLSEHLAAYRLLREHMEL